MDIAIPKSMKNFNYCDCRLSRNLFFDTILNEVVR